MNDLNKKMKIFEKKPIYISVAILLFIFLIMSILIAVRIGPVNISFKEAYDVIFYELFGMGDSSILAKGPTHDIVWIIRLPRLVLAVAVGAGLSVVGVVMQAVVKNPIADPYVLGISSGASLGATAAMLLGVGSFLGDNFIGICAFIGAFGVSMLVLIISNIGGRSNSVKLLLAGMALSSVCSAFSSLLVYFSDNGNAFKQVVFWLMGNLAGAKWEQLVFILPSILIGCILLFTQYRTLNLMLLGDETAITLGTDLHKYRQLYLVISSFMVGVLVYSAGVIGFIGLIIPHFVRMMFGTDHKKIIPIACLVGAIFLVWCDVLSKILIKNVELPVGLLISVIGAPCFIWMIVRKTYGFGGGN